MLKEGVKRKKSQSDRFRLVGIRGTGDPRSRKSPMKRTRKMRTSSRVLVAVVLIGVFNLCYSDVASADITIDDDFVHVDTDNYTVEFYKGSIGYIHNKLTDETYTLREGKLGWTGVQFKDGDDRSTRWASLISTKQVDPLKAELLFQHKETEIQLFITVDPVTDDLLIDLEGESDRHEVVGVRWGVSYLDIQNLSVIAPVDNGRIITATTPSNYLRYPYPLQQHWLGSATRYCSKSAWRVLRQKHG